MSAPSTPYSLRSRKVSQPARPPTRPHTSHSHSHSHGHSHSHSHGGDTEEAEALAKALSFSTKDKGSRIILYGLASNIFLTAAKGAGGVFLHSASLLADAGHSLSDLLGDIVVLFSWRLSRRPATAKFQFGFGKFEALGSLLLSSLLIAGALGIGYHSYVLFLNAIATTGADTPIVHAAEQALHNATAHAHSHGHHHHIDVLDPNAAWVALMSVIVKEWVYRATLKVAQAEKSNVLMANALHHRSDVFSGALAMAAIIGSAYGFPMLDPIGGIVVAALITKQAISIGIDALKELVDYVTDPDLNDQVQHYILDMRKSTSSTDNREHDFTNPPPKLDLLDVRSIRSFKSGSFTLIDVEVIVAKKHSLAEAIAMQDQISNAVKKEFRPVKEVVVRFKEQ